MNNIEKKRKYLYDIYKHSTNSDKSEEYVTDYNQKLYVSLEAKPYTDIHNEYVKHITHQQESLNVKLNKLQDKYEKLEKLLQD